MPVTEIDLPQILEYARHKKKIGSHFKRKFNWQFDTCTKNKAPMEVKPCWKVSTQKFKNCIDWGIVFKETCAVLILTKVD